jgi:hypothetical protein
MILLINSEKGIALITVIIFIFALSLAWLSFSYMSSYEEGMIQNQIDSDQAAYLAEAGIQQALWSLSQDWDWGNWADNQWGRGGSHGSDADGNYYEWSGNFGDSGQGYSVKIRDNGEIESKIVSTGISGSSNRVIAQVHDPQ